MHNAVVLAVVLALLLALIVLLLALIVLLLALIVLGYNFFSYIFNDENNINDFHHLH